MDALLEDLPLDECLRLLRAESVGRIAVIERDFPVVVPVNYRLVETSGRTWLAVRTRPGNVLDRAAINVAFEIDGIDPGHRRGWSVLARGTLHHVEPEAFELADRFDPEPWIASGRDVWLLIQPFTITGRQLRPPEFEWALHPSGAPLASGHAAAANTLTVAPPRLTLAGETVRMGGPERRRTPSRCGSCAS